MIVARNRIGELDRETVPDAFIVGDAEFGFLPDLGSLAAGVARGGAMGFDAEFEGASTIARDTFLKL